MRRNDAQEGGERIDRGVGYGGFIAFHCGVGIVEGDRVGHATTEHPDVVRIIHAEEAGHCETDNQYGNNRHQSNPSVRKTVSKKCSPELSPSPARYIVIPIWRIIKLALCVV